MVMKRERSFQPSDFNLQQAKGKGVGVTDNEGRQVGTVFVQPVHGTLLAEDQDCGPVGMNTMARRLEQVAFNPQYDAVVIDIQSPGGQVLGTEEMANAIATIRENKPVVAYVNGMAASGGYRLAIEGDEIILGGKTSEVGSIGVMLHYLDFSEYMRKEGISEVKIMSTLSPDKNKFNFSEPQEGDVKLIQSEMLDPLAKEFHASVKSRRPGISSDALTGNMFLAEQAIELGMADSIGTYTQAIERAYELSQKKSSNDNDMGIFNKDDKETKLKAEKDIEALKNDHETAMSNLQDLHKEDTDRLNKTITLQNEEIARLKLQIEDLSKIPTNKVADEEGDEGIPAQDAANKTAPTFKYGGFGEERKNQTLGPRK